MIPVFLELLIRALPNTHTASYSKEKELTIRKHNTLGLKRNVVEKILDALLPLTINVDGKKDVVRAPAAVNILAELLNSSVALLYPKGENEEKDCLTDPLARKREEHVLTAILQAS